MNESTFDKFRARNHGFKHFRPYEVITDAVDLAGTRPARGVRDRKVERDPDRLELLADAIDEGRLPGTRWARDDEQRPIGVEVTRHSGPARGSARPRFSILQRGCAAPPSATLSPSCSPRAAFPAKENRVSSPPLLRRSQPSPLVRRGV